MNHFLFSRTYVHVILLACLFSETAAAATVVTFDDLTGFTNTTVDGSYFDGHGFGAAEGSWSTSGVTFNTSQYGPGWSYSNIDNTSTAGFGNQFAAIPGADVTGTGNYVIGSAYSANGAFFDLSSHQRIHSLAVSNATYAALSMRDGDTFAKEFGGVSGNDPDYFQITFTGFDTRGASGNQTGQVDFLLADFRSTDNSNDYIVDDWQTVDLTTLGNARSIGIAFDGSDVGTFGLNTPAYVAIDQLTITAVPEPAGFALVGIAAFVSFWIKRRRRLEFKA